MKLEKHVLEQLKTKKKDLFDDEEKKTIYYRNDVAFIDMCAIGLWNSDTTHYGRVMYDFSLYDGTGQVVDQFNLNKEYWETPDEPDGPGTVYTYRDIQISKEEYDELIMKIFG